MSFFRSDKASSQMSREEEEELALESTSQPVACVCFTERNGQKAVSFVLRRQVNLGTTTMTTTTDNNNNNNSEQATSGGTKDGNAANGDASSTSAFNCKMRQRLRWEFAWCTVLDDNNFSLLAAMITEHAPGSCYITDDVVKNANNSRAAKKFLGALSSCEAVAKPAAHFKLSPHQSTLLTLVGKANMSFLQGLDQASKAAGCLGCLLRNDNVSKDLSADEAAGSHRVVPLDVTSHMKLDHAAVAALHLFPVTKNEDRFHSLFGTLNVCKTKKIGGRLLERWIRQPLLSVEDIVARQSLVQVGRFCGWSTVHVFQ